ncbi:MAG: CPBP family glutamic-type intramembrane protease, partial [Elusimicrobiales bacterium]|nr:CPBP family glutamic-type intramembrane protease [Elusimicrobiales bacterium]
MTGRETDKNISDKRPSAVAAPAGGATSWWQIAAAAVLILASGSVALFCAATVDKLLLAFGTHLPWASVTILSTLLRTLLLITIFIVGAKSFGISFKESWGSIKGRRSGVALLAGISGMFLVSYATSALYFAAQGGNGALTEISGMSYIQRNLLFGWLSTAKDFSFALSTLIIGPFIEELTGCGLIYLALKKKVRIPAAIAFYAFFFALMHYGVNTFAPLLSGKHGFFSTPPLWAFGWFFLRGIILSASYEFGGTLAVPILIHYFWNITGYYFVWT